MATVGQKKTCRGGGRWWEYLIWARQVDAGADSRYSPTLADLRAYSLRLHED